MTVYCMDDRHSTPCRASCSACADECDPTARVEAASAIEAARKAGWSEEYTTMTRLRPVTHGWRTDMEDGSTLGYVHPVTIQRHPTPLSYTCPDCGRVSRLLPCGYRAEDGPWLCDPCARPYNVVRWGRRNANV